jgi:hypothetical protein
MPEPNLDDLARALAGMNQPPPRSRPNERRPAEPHHPDPESAWPADHTAANERDDDAVIVPQPDLAAFRPRQRTARPAGPFFRTLRFRRTLIPVLFTCGALLPAIGIWSVVSGAAPLADANPALAIFLCATGAVLLLVWLLNVLHVRHELRLRDQAVD